MVGVDESPSSDPAVRWAAREATMCKAGLTVVHGLSPLAVWRAVPIPAELHRQRGQDAVQRALLGSVSTAAVHASRVPVIVVRHSCFVRQHL